MKKNLLTAALVVGVLAPLSAQWTQVGGTVKVKPNTLKYVSGTHTITNGTESNEGNVRVGGKFTLQNPSAPDSNTPTKEFRNEFNSNTSYGQLIIAQDANATESTVYSEYGTPGASSFAYAKVAIPYVGVTALDIAKAAGVTDLNWQNYNGGGTFSSTRYQNPVFMWLNSNYALLDLKANDALGSGIFQPFNYYAINNYTGDLVDRLSTYPGTPANDSHSLSLTGFTVNGTNSGSRNIFGEMLGTYLSDPFVYVHPWWDNAAGVSKPTGFGDNLFLFGNPYTSNIDITDAITTQAEAGNIVGVYQQMSSSFDSSINEGNSNRTATAKKMITWDPSSGTNGAFVGNVNDYVLQVRPFHTFAIKTNGDNFSLDLSDTNKTFDINSAAPKYDGTFNRTGSSSASDDGVNQVNVKLIDVDNNEISNAFVVASNGFEASAKAGNEGYFNELADDVDAIYTLQENENGSVDADLANNKMYINGINQTKYVGLPIYIVNQVVNAGGYKFEFDLSEQLNSSSDKFYFEDTQTGVFQEITSDFSYEFDASETTNDRFAIYWNEGAKLGLDDVVELQSETIIFKDLDTFKVRFSKEWKTADVFVYNMLGQLIHSKKNVDASSDYILPIKNSSAAYVVKTIGDNGEESTKKIIK